MASAARRAHRARRRRRCPGPQRRGEGEAGWQVPPKRPAPFAKPALRMTKQVPMPRSRCREGRQGQRRPVSSPCEAGCRLRRSAAAKVAVAARRRLRRWKRLAAAKGCSQGRSREEGRGDQGEGDCAKAAMAKRPRPRKPLLPKKRGGPPAAAAAEKAAIAKAAAREGGPAEAAAKARPPKQCTRTAEARAARRNRRGLEAKQGVKSRGANRPGSKASARVFS